MSNSKNNLFPISIMVLAGAIASGLGQVAVGTSYGGNFPMVFGGGLMAVGSIIFFFCLLIQSSSEK